LLSQDLKLILEKETAEILGEKQCLTATDEELGALTDLVIVVGGDGSLLAAARSLINSGTPLLGINRGKLGFLTDISPDELRVKITEILAGHYYIEERFLLTAAIEHEQKIIAQKDALNDVVLLPGSPHMIDFAIYVNQQLMCTQRADGQIIATPTGSTAYALSGGGPILHPQLDAIALVPMFPHNLSSRPVVIPAESVIEMVINPHSALPVLSCDGQERLEIPSGARIKITKKSQKLCLVHPLDYDYFKTLRSKLHWEQA